jgi:hypothetical protein
LLGNMAGISEGNDLEGCPFGLQGDEKKDSLGI